MGDLFKNLENKFFVIVGPNVIENEAHVINMYKSIKKICDKINIPFVFKVSFDKANRSSINSYRGVSIYEAKNIFRRLKEEFDAKIITDVHETYQIDIIKNYVDIIQIPAFLCRQTDLLVAAGKTKKIIHIKKGQFCGPDIMHRCVEKILSNGNNKIILCDRGTMFGYNDLIVDPRNLVLMRSDNNLVTMDITHCLQKPGSNIKNGNMCSGGTRELIPTIGRMAVAVGVNGIFMEVHDKPDESKCDAPTQFPLNKLEDLLNELILIRNVSKGLETVY
jgi:2-dehydro-3-deoxyphosphooctonate aldolase (KDO 8-P synthase)